MAHLRWVLTHSAEAQQVAQELGEGAAVYDWRRLAGHYDEVLQQLRRRE
jgi:hypothetical protein